MTIIKIDEKNIDDICRAIRCAGDQTEFDIGFHEKTPGISELCDAIRELAMSNEEIAHSNANIACMIDLNADATRAISKSIERLANEMHMRGGQV